MENLRQLSMVFSPTIFRNIVRNDNVRPFQKKVYKYFKQDQELTNLQLIKKSYKKLSKNYRCEYIYKNNVLLHILKEHTLKDTIVFDEFKIGKSKADLVMLNGSIRIFEIKTELDNLEKLSKQINDYKKVANEINIVTDEKFGETLFEDYKESEIGIIILNDKNKLVTIKKSHRLKNNFDFTTLFKLLRKQEYLDLVLKNYQYIPNVPNTKIFKECLCLLKDVDIIEFQKQVLGKLKERRTEIPKNLKSRRTPKELRHICNSLVFNDDEYERLYDFLNDKDLCISHM